MSLNERKPLLAASNKDGKQDNDYQGITSSSSDSFAYEELFVRDGITCPSCHGTGRISKDAQNDLVALIPYDDDRLKPSKTKQYVILAVVLCLVASGLCLFFVLPRSCVISNTRNTNYTVAFKDNQTVTLIDIWHEFQVNNSNFFSVEVQNITVEATYDWPAVSVGEGFLMKKLTVPSLTTVNVPVLIRTVFSEDNNLKYMGKFCTSADKFSHDIVMQLDVMMTSAYLQHTEENSIKTYDYINCGKNFVKEKPKL